jgi:hypothetical protein
MKESATVVATTTFDDVADGSLPFVGDILALFSTPIHSNQSRQGLYIEILNRRDFLLRVTALQAVA